MRFRGELLECTIHNAECIIGYTPQSLCDSSSILEEQLAMRILVILRLNQCVSGESSLNAQCTIWLTTLNNEVGNMVLNCKLGFWEKGKSGTLLKKNFFEFEGL